MLSWRGGASGIRRRLRRMAWTDCSTDGSTRRPGRVPADQIECCSSESERPVGRVGQALPRPSLRPPWLRLELRKTVARAGWRHPGAAPTVAGARASCVGMMLHQDGSRHEWLAAQAACDLIVTMDDATSEIYSAFLVEEEGTSRPSGRWQVFTDKGMPSSLYTDRGSHYFHTPEAAQGRQGSTHPGRPRPPSARHRAHRCLFARGPRPLRARLRHPPGPPRQGTGVGGDRDGRSRRPLHRRHLPARPQSPLRHPARARRQRLRAPRPPRPANATSSACTQSA